MQEISELPREVLVIIILLLCICLIAVAFKYWRILKQQQKVVSMPPAAVVTENEDIALVQETEAVP